MGKIRTLHVGRNLDLPIDAVTQTFGMIGRRGSGKTNAAGVLVEEMLDARAQVVVLDPIGNWAGLRTASDGKGLGYSIPVLGGQHGDVPLEPGAGAVVADLVIDKAISAIVDVSEFRKNKRKEFVTAFAEQLFHRKKRLPSPVHIVLEEAQLFAPQHAPAGEARMLGAMEDIVRLGRNYGIGATLISQRPQSVNKNVLSQVEALFVFQLNGSHERKAIEAWVVDQGIDVGKMVSELPALPVGTAFVWSPQWLGMLERHRIRKKKTFDASATPKVGQKVVEPRQLKPAEVDELRGAMADVVERAEENDPKALRRRLAAAEAKVRKLEGETARIDPEEANRLREEGANQERQKLCAVAERLDNVRESSREALQMLIDGASELIPAFDTPLEMPDGLARVIPLPTAKTAPDPLPPRRPRPVVDGYVQLQGRGARRMLSVLAQRSPVRLTTAQWATLSQLKRTSGTWSTYLSRLKTAGYVDREGSLWYATEAGIAAAGVLPPAPQTTEELVAMWKERIDGRGAKRMLEILVERYPRSVSRDELAAEAEITMTGGTFGAYLSRLRSNGLVEHDGGNLRASAVLFEV